MAGAHDRLRLLARERVGDPLLAELAEQRLAVFHHHLERLARPLLIARRQARQPHPHLRLGQAGLDGERRPELLLRRPRPALLEHPPAGLHPLDRIGRPGGWRGGRLVRLQVALLVLLAGAAGTDVVPSGRRQPLGRRPAGLVALVLVAFRLLRGHSAAEDSIRSRHVSTSTAAASVGTSLLTSACRRASTGFSTSTRRMPRRFSCLATTLPLPENRLSPEGVEIATANIVPSGTSRSAGTTKPPSRMFSSGLYTK